MKQIKCIITLIAVLCLFQTGLAEKRVQPLPLEEFADPSSPSYVPCPYPETTDELIEDFKYIIKKLFTPKKSLFEILLGSKPSTDPLDEILANLFKENSTYRIGQIVKVKNFNSKYSHDYAWLINILDQDDSIAARVVINASGLFYGAAAAYYKYYKFKKLYIKTDDEICKTLTDALGVPITKKDIYQVERASLMPGLGTYITPAFEIKLKNGKCYYFRERDEKTIFKIKHKKPWKKNARGFRPYWLDVVSAHDVFAYDTVEDEIIVYEKVKKE